MNRNTPKDKSSRSKVLNFHCADVMPNCDWRFSGASEEEILLAIEQHGARRAQPDSAGRRDQEEDAKCNSTATSTEDCGLTGPPPELGCERRAAFCYEIRQG